MRDDELELGFVSGTFGVRGEVRLHLHNPDSEFLSRARSVILIGRDGERFRVSLKARPGAGRRILGRLRDVHSKNVADALKGLRIVVERRHLPELEDDEFYLWEVEGLAVVCDDERVGTVTRVHTSEEMDVFEIELGASTSVFVPCLREFVTAVDVRGGRLVVTREALEEDE